MQQTLRTAVFRRVLDFLYGAAVEREVHGAHHVPRRGGCVLVFNHLSNFDPHLLFTVLPRLDATGLVAADYRGRTIERFLVEGTGAIWLRRGAGDRRALEAALVALQQGWVVGLAPEGGRSPTATLGPGYPGAAFLASRAEVPVLPVAVTGTQNMAAAMRRLRRITVTVRFGETFRLPAMADLERRERLRCQTDLIMSRIAALLPPAYLGEPRPPVCGPVYPDPTQGEPADECGPVLGVLRTTGQAEG